MFFYDQKRNLNLFGFFFFGFFFGFLGGSFYFGTSSLFLFFSSSVSFFPPFFLQSPRRFVSPRKKTKRRMKKSTRSRPRNEGSREEELAYDTPDRKKRSTGTTANEAGPSENGRTSMGTCYCFLPRCALRIIEFSFSYRHKTRAWRERRRTIGGV